MNSNMSKNIEKIAHEFGKISRFTKSMLKYSARIFLALFALGTIIVVLNHSIFNYESYIEFIARQIIKSSFIVFAELVIGALLLDYLFNKNKA